MVQKIYEVLLMPPEEQYLFCLSQYRRLNFDQLVMDATPEQLVLMTLRLKNVTLKDGEVMTMNRVCSRVEKNKGNGIQIVLGRQERR